MRTRDALARARKILGRGAVIRDAGPKSAVTPEERAAARAELEILRSAPTRENYDRRTELLGTVVRFRFSVGTVYTIPGLGSGMSVLGTGDSWEEALEAAEKRGRG